MSARSKAARYLMAGRPMTHDEAEAMLQGALDEHAHELAEKIRQEIQSFKDHGVLESDKDWAASSAADFIDPAVSDGY